MFDWVLNKPTKLIIDKIWSNIFTFMIFLTMVTHLLTLKKLPYVPSDLVSIKARFSGSGKNSIFISLTYAPVGFAWRGSFTYDANTTTSSELFAKGFERWILKWLWFNSMQSVHTRRPNVLIIALLVGKKWVLRSNYFHKTFNIINKKLFNQGLMWCQISTSKFSHKVAIGTINLVRMQSLSKSKTPLTSYLPSLTHDMISIFKAQEMLVFS